MIGLTGAAGGAWMAEAIRCLMTKPIKPALSKTHRMPRTAHVADEILPRKGDASDVKLFYRWGKPIYASSPIIFHGSFMPRPTLRESHGLTSPPTPPGSTGCESLAGKLPLVPLSSGIQSRPGGSLKKSVYVIDMWNHLSLIHI